MNRRPSNLDALSQCPCFESEGSTFAEAGSDRHAALADALLGDTNPMELLPDDEIEGVKWAFEKIKFQARTSEFPLNIEKTRSILLPNFDELRGTPDADCGPELWDFKWRARDYKLQMAAYALFIIEELGCQKVTVHLLYGATQYEQVLEFTAVSAWDAIAPVLENTSVLPTPCDYCSWCSKVLTCPPIVALAATVAKGYGELADVSNWHPSEMMNNAQEIAMGMRIRQVLRKWVDSMQHHGDMAAIQKGMEIPGCELKETKGKQWVSDTLGSYKMLGMPSEDFLKACDVRLNTSTKYKEKLGVIDLFHKFNGLPSKAEAKRQVLTKLEPFIKRGASTKHLRVVGESEETE